MNNKNTLFFILCIITICSPHHSHAAAQVVDESVVIQDLIAAAVHNKKGTVNKILSSHPHLTTQLFPESLVNTVLKDNNQDPLPFDGTGNFNILDIAIAFDRPNLIDSLHRNNHISFDTSDMATSFLIAISQSRLRILTYLLNKATQQTTLQAAQFACQQLGHPKEAQAIILHQAQARKNKLNNSSNNQLQPANNAVPSANAHSLSASQGKQHLSNSQIARASQPAIQAPDQKDQEFQDLVENKTRLFLYLKFKEFDKARALLTQDPSLANGPFTQKMVTIAESYLKKEIGYTYNGEPTPSPIKDQTPVGLVIDSGDTDGLRMLHKEFAADLNVYPKEGTALHLAARAGHRGIIGYLLEIGFDPTQPNPQGKTPFQIAKKAHPRIANFIQEYQRKQEAEARPTSSSLDDIDDIFAEIEATGAPSQTATTQSKKQPKAKKNKPNAGLLKVQQSVLEKETAVQGKAKAEELKKKNAELQAQENARKKEAQEKAQAAKAALNREKKYNKNEARKKQREEEQKTRLAREAMDKQVAEEARLLEEARLQAELAEFVPVFAGTLIENAAQSFALEQLQRAQILHEEAQKAALLDHARADLAPAPQDRQQQEVLPHAPEPEQQEYRAQLSEAAQEAHAIDPESTPQLLTLLLHPNGILVPEDVGRVEDFQKLLKANVRQGSAGFAQQLLNSLASPLAHNGERPVLRKGEYYAREDLVELYTTGTISEKQRSNPPLAQAKNNRPANKGLGNNRRRTHAQIREDKARRLAAEQRRREAAAAMHTSPPMIVVPFPAPVPAAMIPTPFAVPTFVHGGMMSPMPVYHDPRAGNYPLVQQRY